MCLPYIDLEAHMHVIGSRKFRRTRQQQQQSNSVKTQNRERKQSNVRLMRKPCVCNAFSLLRAQTDVVLIYFVPFFVRTTAVAAENDATVVRL